MSSDNVGTLEGELLPGTKEVEPKAENALDEAFGNVLQNLDYGPEQEVPGVDPHRDTKGASFASDNDVYELTLEERDSFKVLPLTPEEKELLAQMIIRAEKIGKDPKLNPPDFQSANRDAGLWIKCVEDHLKSLFEGKNPVTLREGVALPPHTGWYDRLLAMG